jgi:hypothetical protein
MAYVAIPDADLVGNAPAKQAVFRQMRDNILALSEFRAIEFKAAAQTVNNSTVLVDDADLEITVASGDVWILRYHLRLTTNASADFKFKITAPGGSTGNIGFRTTPASTSGTGGGTGLVAVNTEQDLLYASDVTGGYVGLDGYVTCGGAGTIKLQWAQNTAHASDTQLLAGSMLYSHNMTTL